MRDTRRREQSGERPGRKPSVRKDASLCAARGASSRHHAGRAYEDAPQAGHKRNDRMQGNALRQPERPRAAAEGRLEAGRADAAPDGSVRINKFIASTGVCSRRRADELIAEGRVTWNGRPAQPGDRVASSDKVCIDGRGIQEEESRICLMLHKPVQVVSTARDPQGRRTVLDFVPEKYRHLRLYPVGRLDYFSEGLLLLTNDGALAQRLTHPSHNQTKVYQVLVRGAVTERILRLFRQGMTLQEGDKVAPCEVEARSLQRETELTMTLHQGLNRQIRRMCRDAGLTVLRLKRIAEGPLSLGRLQPGEVRELSRQEVAALKG